MFRCKTLKIEFYGILFSAKKNYMNYLIFYYFIQINSIMSSNINFIIVLEVIILYILDIRTMNFTTIFDKLTKTR